MSTPITEDGRIRGRIVGAYGKANSYTDLQDTKTRTLYGVVTADLMPGMELTGVLLISPAPIMVLAVVFRCSIAMALVRISSVRFLTIQTGHALRTIRQRVLWI